MIAYSLSWITPVGLTS